ASVLLGYDNDNLLTSAGPTASSIAITRDAQNGRVTGTTLGSITDTFGYDGNGLFQSYSASFSGTALYAETIVSRDGADRITERTESVQGTTHDWVYGYDVAGRLTDVTEDGTLVSHYAYDADDNRTTVTHGSTSVSPITYDAQDRLTTYGMATYSYGANGELQSKTDATGTTQYTYDVFGNLLDVAPPGAAPIDYVIDGENRRVGKKVGGALASGYLYQDALNVIAQLDAGGNVTAQFVFGTKANVPDTMVTPSATYRVISDHLGSVRLVVDAASGAAAEQIDYDEWGRVTVDTSPGFQPFGFAGGLYDKDAGLVRFGARDYDASVGRWTSKDPIRFDGAQINLYAYVGNDPVDLSDPEGAFSVCDLPIIGPILCAIAPPLPPACNEPDCMNFPPPGPTPRPDPGMCVVPEPNQCPPCPTPPPDQVHNVPNQHGCPNGHVHYFKYNQNPQTCTCYLQRLTRCL
ncbi:MAG: RHS repeat-associated core domain-containing protein, partial [Polyangiaceae bacterium]|nr:RHS repeat-associated core domain-containing protein [Polyangiaceae bacterium]